jgi:N-dimethylarginine dimethylaminohydrolase
MNRKLFVCPPTYFDVLYSINPWMDPSIPVDKALAWKQWSRFIGELESLGHRPTAIEPKAGCPDMVFLGDAGVILGDRFLCSRFRHAERAPESEHYARWFGDAGFEVIDVPEPAILEGLGDVAIFGRKAILGHGPRSNPRGFDVLRTFAPHLEVIAEVELPDPRFYHLATAVVWLNEDTVLYYPGGLTPASAEALERAVPRAIRAGDEDILRHQACNCVVLDDVILIDGVTLALEDTLNELGFEVRVCPASELKKGGGSLRCLLLPAID